MDTVLGIDVSHWNRVLSFDRVIAGGYSFLGAKASQGISNTDPTLAYHRDGRRSHADGLVGAIFYHYPDKTHSPEDNAKHFLSVVGPLQADERLCLDVEQGNSGHDAPDIDWQRRFVQYLLQAYPDRPCLDYTAQHIWNEIGNPVFPEAEQGKVDLWAKQYGPALTKIPSPWITGGARFWQCTQSARVLGVENPCDEDVFFGSIDDLKKYFSAPLVCE